MNAISGCSPCCVAVCPPLGSGHSSAIESTRENTLSQRSMLLCSLSDHMQGCQRQCSSGSPCQRDEPCSTTAHSQGLLMALDAPAAARLLQPHINVALRLIGPHIGMAASGSTHQEAHATKQCLHWKVDECQKALQCSAPIGAHCLTGGGWPYAAACGIRPGCVYPCHSVLIRRLASSGRA